MDDGLTQKFAGLDLKHGYLKYIVRNQLDRDEFDKAHEERKARLKKQAKEINNNNLPSSLPESTPRSSTDLGSRMYVPPHRRAPKAEQKEEKKQVRSSPQILSPDEETSMRQRIRKRIDAKFSDISAIPLPSIQNSSSSDKYELFTLQVKNHDTIIERNIYSTDQAARVAKELSREHSFNDAACRQIRMQLEKQISEHLIRRNCSTCE